MTVFLGFQTVDVRRVQAVLQPCVLGLSRIADGEWLTAARTVKSRWRVKAFAVAALDADQQRIAEGFRAKLTTTVVPDLHVWGRPWFVPIEGTEAVADALDRFAAATAKVKAIDALCVDMLGRIELSKESCLERVEQALAGRPKTERAVANDLRGPLDGLYEAARGYRELPRKTAAKRAGWEARVIMSFVEAALNFISWYGPAWMSADRVWPTEVFGAIKSHLPRLFESPDSLFEALALEFPALSQCWSRRLGDTGRIGGFVRPGNMPQLYEMVIRERAQILSWASRRGWPKVEADLFLLKLEEAAFYAMRHQLGFIETRGVFDPPRGVWN